MTTPEPGKWYTAKNLMEVDDTLTVFVKRIEFGVAYCTPNMLGFPVDLWINQFKWDLHNGMNRVTCADVLQEQEVPPCES